MIRTIMPAMPVLHLFALSSRTGKRRGGVFYLFVLLLSLSVLAGECAAPQADSLPAAGGEGSEIAASPTYITIYYEALCPFSFKWLQEQLQPVIDAVTPSVLQNAGISINPIPFGNTQEIPNDKGGYDYICQHGPTECYLNKVEACGLYTIGMNDIGSWLPWLLCVEETSAFPNPKKQKESSSFSALRHEPRPLLLGGRLIRRDESSADKEGHPAASPSASSSFRVGDVADDMGDSLPSEGVSYSFLELSASSSLGKVNESSGEAEEKSDKTFDLSRIAELQKLLKKRLAMKQLEAQKQQGQLDHFGEAAIEKERKRAEQEHRGERLLSSFLQQLQRSQKGGGDGRVYDWVTCPVGKDSQNIIDSLLILACTETQQGDDLIHVAGQATGAHDYVPWVLINGKHVEAAEKDFGCALCDAVDLSKVPVALKSWCTDRKDGGKCASYTHASGEEEEEEGRCYVNEEDRRQHSLGAKDVQQILRLRVAREKEA